MAWEVAEAVFESCRERHIRLYLENGQIVAEGWLTDDLRAAIRQHRNDLLILLGERQKLNEACAPERSARTTSSLDAGVRPASPNSSVGSMYEVNRIQNGVGP